MLTLRSMAVVQNFVDALEKRAPRGLAEEWDNVGLLVGDGRWSCDRLVASVDLTRDGVERALKEKAHLIVCHHPPIFRPIKSLVAGRENDLGSLLLRCLQSQIAVAACHTNFDQAAVEVSEKVAQAVGFVPKGRFAADTSFVKLVTFVPPSHMDSVRAAVFEAGAGRFGAYDQCGFESDGHGGYRPSEGTKPFQGTVGTRSREPETRFETVLPVGLRSPVISALLKTHPYEEVAYDLIPVELPKFKKGVWPGVGYGAWGDTVQGVSLEDLLSRLKATFGISSIRVSGHLKSVKRIGFCAGKATSFVSSATSLGVEALIVGETDYHSALARTRAGFVTLELGHTESEKFFPEVIDEWIRASDLGG